MEKNDVRKGKQLGLWMATALVAGTMIGSGVFLLPASLAQYGGISIFGWLFTSIGAFLLALTLSSLSRKIPKAGGPYAYTQTSFGDFAGFLVGWGYWIGILTAGAAVSVACVGYLSIFWPEVADQQVLAAVITLIIIWVLIGINISGTHRAGWFQIIATVLKILPLILIIAFGFFSFNVNHFTPFNPTEQSDFSAITATASMTLWAFLGLEVAAVGAENVKNPKINVAKATIMGTLVATLIYIGGTLAVMGIIPKEILMESTAPFADAAKEILGDWGGYLVAAGAVISCIGSLNGIIMTQGQMPFALARDQLFHPSFKKLSSQGTPSRALILSGILVTIFIAMNYAQGLVDLFTFIILLSTLSVLLPYVFSTMAEVMLLIKQKQAYPQKQIVKPAMVAIVAFAYAMWAIYGAGERTVYLGILLFLMGIPFYVYAKWKTNSS